MLFPFPVICWNWSNKMRKRDFRFVVESGDTIGAHAMKRTMKESLELIASHYDICTWINDLFIRNTVSLISDDENSSIQYYIFKLFGGDNDLLSISVGYKFGNSFMDFTAATFKRDKTSCGKILLFNQGEFLKNKLGIKLWYLGFKIPYMETLVRDDSAVELDREKFQNLWIC